jgi:hypothetical protein
VEYWSIGVLASKKTASEFKPLIEGFFETNSDQPRFCNS